MRLLRALTFNVSNQRSLSYAKIRTWYAELVKPKPVDPPYQHIIQVGDPRLRTPAEKVPIESIKTKDIQFILQKMYKVFRKFNCVGLSAPQIGINYQIFMMEFNEKQAKTYTVQEFQNKQMMLLPLTVVINPEIKVIDFTKINHSESCESVKGFWADVPRYKEVLLKGYDDESEPIEISAVGWTARIIQHEVDHLQGKLYTDIMDRKTLTCSCWETVNERNGRVLLPFGPQ